MNSPSQPMPGKSAPPPAPSMGAGIAIDPVKLLHKYKYVLAASVMIGMVLGVGAHILLSRFAPKFTANITWKCNPAEQDVEIVNTPTVDETEMDRFMGTQVATMKSQLVLTKVIADPRLQDLAPNWSKQYIRGGNIDIVEAFKDFEGMVSASAVPKTFLIRLSVSAGDKNDAAGLVTMVQDAYLNELSSRYKRDVRSRQESIRDSIQTTNDAIGDLTSRKARLVRDQRIDSIDSARSTSSERLRLINAELVGIQQSLEALTVIRVNDEAQLQRDTGIEYDSSLRETVNISPMILTFKQELKRLQTLLVSLQADGIQPDHRQYKQVVNQINAHQRKIEDTREELLRESFEARVQNTATSLQQLRAQESEMLTQKTDLAEELTELTRISQEIADIDRQIEGKIALLGEQEKQLSDLEAQSNLSSAQRVTVVESATIPDSPTFPVIYVVVPATLFLIVGLTSGIILLFELLDQRIKSAADIRSIPRTRSLGVIMDTCEDPAATESVSTAFADAPGSVFAEHFRQLRTAVLTSMSKHGHRSLVVVGAMPESGASSVVTNLGQASVASGLSTLVIDANFRRPSIHKSLGLGDGPGLGDVLAGSSSFQDAIVNIDQGPDVLRIGTKENRQVERLSGRGMKNLLDEQKANYDLILLDVAPSVVAGDSAILANITDASMLVVRAMSEKRGQVSRVCRELGDSKAEFMGVVVNAVRSAAGGYMRKNIRTSFDYQNTEKREKKASKAPNENAA
ncbi:MAG: GumC family protein [Phycisphaerales bacterium]